MRAWLALLVLLLAFAGLAPACAHPATPHSACHDGGRAPSHGECAPAACIGCATPLPDPARPETSPPPVVAVAAVAAPVRPLAGIRPAMPPPPPRPAA